MTIDGVSRLKPTLILLAAVLTACGGGSSSKTKTVDDVTVTATQIAVPLNTYEAGGYSVQSVVVGNSIYFANYSNTTKAQFFVRYDLGTNTFSSPLATSYAFCACGYMSKLVTDGTDLFYISDFAQKYSAATDTWSGLTYPATAHDNAGEAGTGYHGGNIYFVGGRTPSTRFKYYSIAQDQWFTAADYLYATASSEVVGYKDRVYVLGGAGAQQRVSYYSPAANTWTALKDAPFAIAASYQSQQAAVLGDYLYLLQGSSVYVYDLAKDVWAKDPITVSNLVVSDGELYSIGSKLYASGKSSSNLLAVYELTVGTK